MSKTTSLADVTPPSKWVSCLSGAVRDFFVDLRIDSPTFLEWGFTDLDPTLGRTVLMGKGIGHAFQALENDSTLVYLLDGEYLPEKEFSINPFSDRIKIDWPITIHNLSDKDLNAPSIDDVIKLLESHFSHNYKTHGGSKLPVIAFFAVFKSIVNEVSRLKIAT